MDEAAAAHEAFARVLAEDHAIEIGQVLLAVALADAGAAEPARIGDGVADARRRRGMVGEEVDGVGVAVGARVEIDIALHIGKHARGAVRIEPGARSDADADAVGLEFLRAREAGQRQLRFGERQRAHLWVVHHLAESAAGELGVAHLLLADLGVTRNDVAHLMRQHRGEL